MRRSSKPTRIAGALALISAVIVAFIVWIAFFDKGLTRALGEEKSFMQHGGTLHRLRPELRGQKGNLETWDEAEKIVALSKNRTQGTWAAWSDTLQYLPLELRLDPSSHPMCVIRLNQSMYVVRGIKTQVDHCVALQPGVAVTTLQSGELVPSSDNLAEVYYGRIDGLKR